MTRDDVEALRMTAEAKAREIGLDRMVRDVVRILGQGDAARSNYAWTRETPAGLLELRATFAAGAKTASVRVDGVEAYRASDYGKYIETFRSGRWVGVLTEYATEARDARAAEELTREVAENVKTAEKFSPLDEDGAHA